MEKGKKFGCLGCLGAFLVFCLICGIFSVVYDALTPDPSIFKNIDGLQTIVLTNEDQPEGETVVTKVYEALSNDSLVGNASTNSSESYEDYAGDIPNAFIYELADSSETCTIYQFNDNQSASDFGNYLYNEHSKSCLVAGNILLAIDKGPSEETLSNFKETLSNVVKSENERIQTEKDRISRETETLNSLVGGSVYDAQNEIKSLKYTAKYYNEKNRSDDATITFIGFDDDKLKQCIVTSVEEINTTNKTVNIIASVPEEPEQKAEPGPLAPTGGAELNSQAQSESYIGNINTHKFHHTWCGHLPDSKNQVVLNSRDEAVNAGYEPCGFCNP